MAAQQPKTIYARQRQKFVYYLKYMYFLLEENRKKSSY